VRGVRCAWRFVLVSTVGLAVVAAAAPRPGDDEALRASQAAIGRTVAGVELITADGGRLSFEELRGRPVVLSLVYTSCYHVCSGLTLRLRDTVKVARQALGAEAFNVVTVGFDTPNDRPERMQAYARERGALQSGWYFAVTDSVGIKRLVGMVGFTYFPLFKGFDHIT